MRPIVYITAAFATNILGNHAALAGYPLWLALYTDQSLPSVPKPWSSWTFWQYTQTGTAEGIAGNVDRNHFNGTSDGLKALAFAPPVQNPSIYPYAERVGPKSA